MWKSLDGFVYRVTKKFIKNQDLLLRQCACIGSNMMHKSYSQSFNDLVLQFDLSPGCSFAMHCCRRLFGVQLRARRICDPLHGRHSDEMQRLLLWTALCHFLGNCCTSNTSQGMYLGGILCSAGFIPWLKSTLPGFSAIIPAETAREPGSGKSEHAAAPATMGRKQSQSGLLYTHTANTYEEYAARTTEDGSEELNLTKTQKISLRSVAQSGITFVRRPSTAIRTDTFDSWNQHGLRTLAIPAASSSTGSFATSSSLLKHAVPTAAAVVEAAICQLMRLISNFGELLPSILLTAPFDPERVNIESRHATPPSVNGVELLCEQLLLPKLLDFFEVTLQFRSAALYAAAVLLKMQDRSIMDADIAARIQSLLLSICRRYFPKIMKSVLHEFVCIAPRCVASVPSSAELHQLVGVAYESIDSEIQKLLSAGSGRA